MKLIRSVCVDSTSSVFARFLRVMYFFSTVTENIIYSLLGYLYMVNICASYKIKYLYIRPCYDKVIFAQSNYFFGAPRVPVQLLDL